MKLARFAVIAALCVVSVAVAGSAWSSPGRAVGDPLRPDLINLRPRQMSLSITAGGDRRLRFTSYTVNVGAGPMQLRSRRFDCNGNGDTTDDRTAVQHTYLDATGDGIYDPAVDTATSPHIAGCFAFDVKHGHWHYGDFEVFRLLDPHTGAVLALHRKVGFCLADDFATYPDLPGAPRGPVYIECTRDATQGISVGWTDIYPASLPSQWIDVTGIPNGRYCLSLTVDPSDRLLESDDTNNAAARMIRLTDTSAVAVSGVC